MRSQLVTLIVGAVMFIGVGYLLIRGFQSDERQDRRSERIATDTGRLAESTRVVAEATEKIGESVKGLNEKAVQTDARLDRAEESHADLERRVGEIEEVIPTREAAIAAGFIANDMGAVSGMAKVAIAESMMSNGRMPNSNAEAGLPVSTDLRGRSLTETRVIENGIVELIFDETTGVDGGLIRLVPDAELAMRTGIVNWRCETDDYPEIEKVIPACSFTGSR
jgi:hypothetical protein